MAGPADITPPSPTPQDGGGTPPIPDQSAPAVPPQPSHDELLLQGLEALDPLSDVRKTLRSTPAVAPAPDMTPQIKTADLIAQQYTPERAAKLSALADKTGFTPEILDTMFDDMQRKQQSSQTDVQELQDYHKRLANWVTQPMNAAIARGDLPALTALSASLQNVVGAPDNRPSEPWGNVIRTGLNATNHGLSVLLDTVPAMAELYARKAIGADTTTTNQFTPLGAYNWDQQVHAADAAQAEQFKPSGLKDFSRSLITTLADPMTYAVPLTGAKLALNSTKVIEAVAAKGPVAELHAADPLTMGTLQGTKTVEHVGEQLLGDVNKTKLALTGAGAGQGALAGAQTAAQQSEQTKEQDPGVLANTANVAAQTALGYFFGKSGGLIGLLRNLRSTPWTSSPIRDYVTDIGRQSIIGATQASVGNAVSGTLTGSPIDSIEAALSGGIAGAALAGVNLHEAMVMQHHLTRLQNSSALENAGRLLQTFESAQQSKAQQLAPDQTGKFEQEIARDGISHQYLTLDQFQDHHLSLDRDPAKAAQDADLMAEYQKAKSLGTSMQIPMKTVTEMGAESKEPALLAAEFRQHPDAPNGREAVTFYQGGGDDQELNSNLALASQQVEAGRGAGDTKGQMIADEVSEQARRSGTPAEQADALGKIHQSIWQTLAGKMNEGRLAAGLPEMTATDLRDHMSLNIMGVAPRFLQELVTTGHADGILNRMRTDGPKTTTEQLIRRNLMDLGLDVHKDSNEDIVQAVQKHIEHLSGQTQEQHAKNLAGDRPVVLEGHPGTTHNQPIIPVEGDDISRVSLLRQWRAKHGGRLPDPNDKEWQKLKSESAIIDRQRLKQRQRQADAEAAKSAQRKPHGSYDAAQDKRNANAVEKSMGRAAIQEHLKQTLKEMDRVPLITAGHVPYGMGMNADGSKLYRDPKFPLSVKLPGGITVDTKGATSVHEVTETRLMKSGVPYEHAHDIANAVEREYLRGQGFTEAQIDEYENSLKPGLRNTREWTGKPPADLNPAPYVAEGETKLLHPPGERTTSNQGEDEVRGSFTKINLAQGGFRGVMQLYSSKNASTAFHESAHYFLEVMGRLTEMEGAPQSLKDDFQKIMEWSGYGDRATMLEMQSQLADLQLKIGDRAPTDEEKEQLATLNAPHERFARGFERYLREGVAPASNLRKAFAMIKGWMLSVYKSASELNVELNPEIREIFGRMLASDAQIAKAKERVSDNLAFENASDAGWTPEQHEAYLKLAAEADQQQKDELEKENVSIFERTLTKAYRDEQRATRARVTDDVAQQRVYSAMNALQNGKTGDGREIGLDNFKISKLDVERILGDHIGQLPGPGAERNSGRNVYSPEGMPADTVAKMLGYKDGVELLTDLAQAPDRKTVIDQQVAQHMNDRYPDLMKDPARMQEAADRTLHDNDARQRLMDMERAQLIALDKMQREQAKAVDKQDKAEAGAAAADEKARQDTLKQHLATVREERAGMRLAAEQTIQDTKLSNFSPDQFQAAERRAAINLREAMVKKKWQEAIVLKRQQMMNSELYRAAMDAREQAFKDQARLARYGSDPELRKALGKATGYEWQAKMPDGTINRYHDGNDETNKAAAIKDAQDHMGTYERTNTYLDQIDHLLYLFDMKNQTPRALRRMQSLRDFLNSEEYFDGPDGERYPLGLTSSIPDWIKDQASKTNWKDLTIQQLHDLRSAAQQIEALAKWKNKLTSSTNKADLKEAVAEIAAVLKENSLGKRSKKIGVGAAEGLIKATKNFKESLNQMNWTIYGMDGFKEGGRLWDLFMRPRQEAADRELALHEKYKNALNEAMGEWGKVTPLNPISLNMRFKVPGTDVSISHWSKIMALMHYGNPEGRQRLMDGYNWSHETVHKIIDTLDAKDIKFANRLVDIMSMDWSAVKELAERRQGIAPPKVESIPVDMPNGQYKGGYMRLYYDGLSKEKIENISTDAAFDGMRSGAVSNMVEAGHRKSRTAVLKDVTPSLDPNSWTRALSALAHDLSHADVVADQAKLLANKDLRRAMELHFGEGSYREFFNNLKGIAQGDVAPLDSMSRVLSYLRTGYNVTTRGVNAFKAIQQYAGLPLILTRIPARYVMSSVIQHWSGPLAIDNAAHFAEKYSIVMRNRAATFNKSMQDSMAGISLKGPTQKFTEATAYYMWTKVFGHMDSVTWKAAYDQHMAESANADQPGGDHDKAVRVADGVMESLMGSGKQKDIPDILRGSYGRIFGGNMSWSLSNWNAVRSALNQTRYGWQRGDIAGHMARGLGSLGVLLLAGPMLWDWMYDELKGKDMSKYTTAGGLGKELISAPANAVLGSIPILRDISDPLLEGKRSEGDMGLHGLDAVGDAMAAFHAKHYKEATIKAAALGAGTLLHVPSAALFQAMEGSDQADQEQADFLRRVWIMSVGKTPKK